MTPEENSRLEHWVGPLPKKEWIAEKEIEPWNLFVCGVIKQALNDMIDPEPIDIGNWSRWDEDRRNAWRRSASIEAEQFFYSDKLEYWCDQFDCNIDADLIKTQMLAFKKLNQAKIDKTRGITPNTDNLAPTGL